jgi:DNA-binding NtrC family response regulator
MENRKNPLIYMVDDDPAFRKMIDSYLKINRLTNVKQFSSGESMLEELSKEEPMAVIEDFDLGPGKLNGLEIFKKSRMIKPGIEFIFLSGQSSIEVAVDAIKLGAYDYVVKDEFAKENILNRMRKFIYQRVLFENQKMYKIVSIVIVTVVLLVIIVSYILGGRLVWER